MTATLKKIVQEARELTPVERAKLLEEIYKTFDHDIDTEIEEKWVAEAEDRLQAYEDGKIKAQDYEEIRKQIK